VGTPAGGLPDGTENVLCFLFLSYKRAARKPKTALSTNFPARRPPRQNLFDKPPRREDNKRKQNSALPQALSHRRRPDEERQ
jgi:hypothetical protein